MDASGIVINDGSNDRDFRIESNDSDGMLFVDGGNNRVGVGTSSPGTILHTRTSDATSNNNAGGGFHHTSSSTAANRRAQLFLDADTGDFGTSSDGAYAYIEKHGDWYFKHYQSRFFRYSFSTRRFRKNENDKFFWKCWIGNLTPTL